MESGPLLCSACFIHAIITAFVLTGNHVILTLEQMLGCCVCVCVFYLTIRLAFSDGCVHAGWTSIAVGSAGGAGGGLLPWLLLENPAENEQQHKHAGGERIIGGKVKIASDLLIRVQASHTHTKLRTWQGFHGRKCLSRCWSQILHLSCSSHRTPGENFYETWLKDKQ